MQTRVYRCYAQCPPFKHINGKSYDPAPEAVIHRGDLLESLKCAVFDRLRLWEGGDARLKRQGTIVLVLAVEILESLKRRSADSGGSILSREMPEGARLQICSLA